MVGSFIVCLFGFELFFERLILSVSLRCASSLVVSGMVNNVDRGTPSVPLLCTALHFALRMKDIVCIDRHSTFHSANARFHSSIPGRECDG